MAFRIAILISFLSFYGCTNLAGNFASNLSTAIQNQNDPEIVAKGIPTYLLMLDSLIINNPKDSDILRASASLNSTYATLFAQKPEEARLLTTKAKSHARQAICQKISSICLYDSGTLSKFQTALSEVNKNNVDLLYTYGTAWASWVQTHKDDWDAMAQVPKVQAIMERVVELDEAYEWGRAHVYLGVIFSQIPPAPWRSTRKRAKAF